MGLFDTLKGPVFFKESDSAEQRLHEMEELLAAAKCDAADAIAREILILKAGIAGERQIHFELENSHIPMYVLHDLYLENGGLSAQIDYLLITHYHEYVLECKNLVGDIEINNSGEFIRTTFDGKTRKREGLYSPITQNRRHLELIRELRGAEKNFIAKALFEKNYYNNYKSLVVLANPKTVLNARYAKKEIKEQVIRADQLADYIRKQDAAPGAVSISEREMEELAAFFMAAHKENRVDYTECFRKMLASEPGIAEEREERPAAMKRSEAQKRPDGVARCPKCGAPMIRRRARQGSNAGNEFFGCSNYPKCRGIVAIRK